MEGESEAAAASGGSEAAAAGRERRATAPTTPGGEWMRPCPNLDPDVDGNATPQVLAELILRAIHEAKSQVDHFINDFAMKSFEGSSWEEALQNTDLESLVFPFLNNSSNLDLKSPQDLSFPVALQEAYELMQRRAVGIEQVTLDQALYQASFLSEFRHVEDRIVHILCELRHAMLQSGVSPNQDVTKDVMDETLRDIDSEYYRNLRDTFILREYISGLETLHSLFNYYAASNPQ